MRICIITPDYPDERRSVFTFVKQLVDEMATQGNICYVIAPYSITHNKHWNRNTKEQVDFPNGGKVIIYRPNIVTLSTIKICGFEPSRWAFQKATNRILNNLLGKIDCIYGHFWSSGLIGYHFAKKHNIPLFVATGESEIPNWIAHNKYKDYHNYVSGVVCVSSKNRDESVAMGLTHAGKCIVIPNAVNPQRFRLLDKDKCREALGLPLNCFIAITIGWFSERKGTKKLSLALDSIQDGNIYSIFIGSGSDEPTCSNILFKGRVTHEKIPVYLNAADIFVLPTLHEGCCNAVIEAMACGLPIISSDLPFNYDVLNSTNSIMVDPNNIKDIAFAIKELYNNKHRRELLSHGALQFAQQLTIESRARLIIEYISRMSQI